MLATEGTEMTPSHTSPTLGFPTPGPGVCNRLTVKDGWRKGKSTKGGGAGLCDLGVLCGSYELQTVEVPNVRINGRITNI